MAWAVCALGNDQSEGMVTKSSVVDGRGRRNTNFAIWTEIMVISKLAMIKIACPDLPDKSSGKQIKTEIGKRRYSDPIHVSVVKKRSIVMYVIFFLSYIIQYDVTATFFI